MSQTKTAPTNGATKETPAPSLNGKQPENAKPELSNLQVSQDKPLTIEQKRAHFQELGKLMEKREKVLDALDDLKDFQISPTGGANLKLTDSRNQTFAIAHPIVIGEMVAVAKQRLQQELALIETQFIF